MILSQLPTSTASEFGLWVAIALGTIGSVVAIAVGVKKLLTPSQPGTEHVTRAEFRTEFSKLEKAISDISDKFATKSEVSELRTLLKETKDYLHQSVHEIRGVISPLPTQVKTITEQFARLDAKLDRTGEALVRTATLIELHIAKIAEKET